MAVAGHGLGQRYGEGSAAVDALRDVSVEFVTGSFTAIMGPSGSGKSTLLNALAGLERPTSGWSEIAGVRLDGLSDRELTLLRREKVGFVFQDYNLLPVLTGEENICLPLSIGGQKPDPEWLATLVSAMGIGGRIAHLPDEMSGESSSGSPWLAPWCRSRPSSSPMSPPGTWTRARAARSWT